MQKHLKITKNGWGSDYVISLRVRSHSEAKEIQDAVEVLGYDITRYSPSPKLDEALPLPTADGQLDLSVPINTQKNMLEVIRSLAGRVLSHNELLPKSLENTDEMRRWVFWSFAEINSGRSKVERDLLFAFRTSGYKGIQKPLRDSKGPFLEMISDKVAILDQAIQMGSLDRDVVIYHANPDPALEEIWNQGLISESVLLPIDPAYTFTSMLKSFATWWSTSQYGGKGVILEIRAEKGSHMIPMERLPEGAGPEWLMAASELEFLLPRNSKFLATGASKDAEGNKILHCQLVIFGPG